MNNLTVVSVEQDSPLTYSNPSQETLYAMTDGDDLTLDWLSADLIRELQMNKPEETDIDNDTGNTDKNALFLASSNVFTVNRQFINFYQAKQFVDSFSDPWGMAVTQESDRIYCCFGLAMKERKQSISPDAKQRRELEKGTNTLIASGKLN